MLLFILFDKKVNMVISKRIQMYYLILKLITEIYIYIYNWSRLKMINNKKIYLAFLWNIIIQMYIVYLFMLGKYHI